VPENRAEITTEGGLDAAGQIKVLTPTVKRLQNAGIRVSLFIEPEPTQLAAARQLGAEMVELHTGAFANATGKARDREVERLITAAEHAQTLGIQVNAGHGINYTNIAQIRKIPHLAELNIGHSIVSRALFVGLEKATAEMLAAMTTYDFEGKVALVTGGAGGIGSATVRQLASHTSGLTYWFWNADMVRYEELTGTGNAMSGKREMFTLPLVADPGSRFEYGINADWLGLVVEAASGQTLDAYFAEHILGPLGMTQTTFLMSPEQRANSVPVHLRGESGAWEATELDWSQEPEWFAGGHGLYATPRDYLKFQRMLLGGGTLDGTKIVEPASLDEAFSNQIGELDFPPAIATADPGSSADFNAGPGYKFGLGLLLNSEDQPGARKAGSGAWAGIFNSHFWVDRSSGVTGAIYSQTLPFVEPPVFQMYADFERALYASLDQGTVRTGRFVRDAAEVPQTT